jgi:hypothetical protein
MVLTVHIDRWDMSRILIDNSSQAEILFLSALKKMGYDKKQLKDPTKPLYGFGGKRIKPVRVITLPVSFGTKKTPHIIHNLQCGRHAISLQCHIWVRPIEHLQRHPAFRVALPQCPNNL